MTAEGVSAEAQCSISTFHYGFGPWLSTDVCDWYGVACLDSHIVALCLVNNNMNGTLVDLALPMLRYLTIIVSPQLTGQLLSSYATALPLVTYM